MKDKDLLVTSLRKKHTPDAMLTVEIEKGVRVEHIPTGCAVECKLHRSMNKNKEDAIAALELMVGL